VALPVLLGWAFSDPAAQGPAEAIARENEVVTRMARERGFAERPCEESIQAQPQGLVVRTRSGGTDCRLSECTVGGAR
jgi:hypothetical protein